MDRNDEVLREKDSNDMIEDDDFEYNNDLGLKESEFIIKCTDIVKEYDLGEYIVRAIDGVSLEIKHGDFVAIQGPSGAGKTTLLYIIAGLDEPTQGEVNIDWVKTSDLNEEMMSIFRLVNIGFIFQNFNLISSLTAEENISFAMQLAGIDSNMQKLRSKDLLAKVKLPERDEHLPFQLSAGEQQRVGIARALANDPPIILADEPTANLDAKSSEIIAELFKMLSDEGKTIIVATHDERLLNHAYRIITFDDGNIIDDRRIIDLKDIDQQKPKKIIVDESIKAQIAKNENYFD